MMRGEGQNGGRNGGQAGERLTVIRDRLQRYAAAGIGPFAGAGAQFLLSLILLRVLPPADFGSFAFLLVASIFAAGIWAALFCAPLPVLLNELDEVGRRALIHCLFSANILAALAACAIFFGIGLALRISPWAAALFAVYVTLFLLRWFARAYAYAADERHRTMYSDLVYACTLLAGIGTVLVARVPSLAAFCLVLLLSAFTGLLPFGIGYLRRQFSMHAGVLADYAPIWRRHSAWSLLGVVTTEVTMNAHVYIVTLFAGPAAYAPIAATALMIRPIGVAQNALVEYERAQMAMDIASRRTAAIRSATRWFRAILIGAWLATAALLAGLLAFAPRLIFPHDYPLQTLVAGTALWMGVAAIRLIRSPESTVLEAGGAFRALARGSSISCVVSVAVVGFMLVAAGPLWSILGIMLGEAVFLIFVRKHAKRWLASRQNSTPPPLDAPPILRP